MYHMSTSCVEKEGQVEDDLWNKTLVPGGAKGISLQSKFLLMAAWAEMLRFVREDWSRLRVITA